MLNIRVEFTHDGPITTIFGDGDTLFMPRQCDEWFVPHINSDICPFVFQRLLYDKAHDGSLFKVTPKFE